PTASCGRWSRSRRSCRSSTGCCRARATSGVVPSPPNHHPQKEITMHRRFFLAALCLCAALSPAPAHSFCGFYVATGDAKLFNKSSQVVLVRDGDRTVLTMGSDFKGEPSQFALVVPVPVVLERDQIHVGDQKIVEHLDAYSAPRLVEYFDEDPCTMVKYEG